MNNFAHGGNLREAIDKYKVSRKKLLKDRYSKSKKKRNGFIIVVIASILAFEVSYLIIVYYKFVLHLLTGMCY